MVSNSSAAKAAGSLGKKNPEKKASRGENAGQRSPSPPTTKGKEVARYEFDGKAVPKGLRTDREKKKIFVKKPGAEPENGSPQAPDAGDEQVKHAEKVRGPRSSKPRSKPPEEEKQEKKVKPEELEQKEEAGSPPEAKQAQEQVEEAQESPKLEIHPETTKEMKIQEEPGLNSSPSVEHEGNDQELEPEEAPADMKLEPKEEEEEQKKASTSGAQNPETPPQKEHEEEQEKVVNPNPDPDLNPNPNPDPNPEPDTSLSLGLSGSHHRVKRVRSVQSFSQAETFSHGITTSLSLSCSHAFTHNPSCSLTQTSFDNTNNNQEFSSASHHETSRSIIGGGDGIRMGDHSVTRGRTEIHQQHSHHHPRAGIHRKPSRSSGGGFSRSAGFSERPRPVPSSSQATGIVTVREIVSDPVPSVARRLQESPPELIEELKATVRDLLERSDRKEEFLQLQRILQSRNDLVDEVLYTTHRSQLEILVALKTGIPAYLGPDHQPKTLVEIFLSLRCRKAQCLSQLPADNCECRLCTRGDGFCNVCMCVVCSTFDFEQNTCGWVGCDFCIHWCHTDCGLRKSYIKPGPAINGGPGTSEMQFHCLVCGKTSELFGFVKDVFTSCAEGWSRAQLSKELDCVRRMFQGSEDLRGKQLCWKAGQLFGKLESSSGSEAPEACRSMLRFFEDGTINPLEEEEAQGAPGAGAGAARESIIERATMALQSYDRVLEEKRSDAAEMQYERARKRAEIEELESIVRIKQAEAKMFQSRADEAAREAEGLRQIVLAKRLKVEEEYAAKKSKLQLLEAEEKRKRKFEDLKKLESSRSCDFEMLRKVMGDLQGLLSTMEAAKRFKTEDEVPGVERYLQRYLQQQSR